MLDDLRDIESKGYSNQYKNKSLILTIKVTKNAISDKNKNGLSYNLYFSLNCPALSPTVQSVGEKYDTNGLTALDKRMSGDSSGLDRNMSAIYRDDEMKNNSEHNENMIGMRNGDNNMKNPSDNSGPISQDKSRRNSHNNTHNSGSYDSNTNSNSRDLDNRNNDTSPYTHPDDKQSLPIDHFLALDDNLSAVRNDDDYSTILMTCIALTSRAAGSFHITRNKAEFCIQCFENYDYIAHSSDIDRRAESVESGKHMRGSSVEGLGLAG